MADHSAKAIAICRGARVRRALPSGGDRIGLVVEVPSERAVSNSKRPPWAEVMPEGSSTSRTELWPIAEISLLPQVEQLPLLGGSFQPPKGYPLTMRRS